jgi:Leucine rich repeat
LFVAHNLLSQLPSTINRLKKLELLDISHNEITDIRCISFMPELRVLNVSGNKNLKVLPPELATCENLSDVVFDLECILSPSADVLATGTNNILKYLSTGELTAATDYATEDKILKQSKVTTSRIMTDSAMTKKFMDKERFIMTQDDNILEGVLLKEQQSKKEQMLKSVMESQKQAENAVNKLQSEKDVERKKLIDDILQCE